VPKVDITVGELVDMINRGELRLPSCSAAMYGPRRVSETWSTPGYRGYASGTILVWETDLDVPARAGTF
jgi:hypothetical protein